MIKKLILLFFVYATSYCQSLDFKKRYDDFIAKNKKDYSEIDAFFKADSYDTIKLNYVLKKSKATKSTIIEAYIANKLGVYFRDISSYKKSLYYHSYGLKLSKKIQNIPLETVSYNMLGVVYRRMDSIKPAIDNHQNALNLIEKIKTPLTENLIRSKAISLNSLGNIYLTLNQQELALQTFYKSLAIEKKIGNNLGMAINYQNIGGVYENRNDLNSALINYKTSLAFNEKINSEIGFMICKNSIGIVLLKQNKAREAFDYIFPTIEIAKKSQDDFYISSSYINLGWAYFELNELEKAKQNINIGLKIASEKKFPSYIALSYMLLAKIAEKQNNFKLGNNYLKKYYENKEKVSGEKNQNYLFNFISKYENEKKEATLKLKDNELKINKLKLVNKEKEKWLYIGGLLLFGIIGSLLFYQSHTRKKINQKLQLLNTKLDQANQTKKRFFNVLNHDLRSPVANLIHFLHLQNDSPELLDEATKNRMQTKTITGAENLLASMEDILLWSKGQMQNFKPQQKNISVANLFLDTKNHFASTEKINFTFLNNQNIEIFTDDNYLKTIIRNLTANAIKALSTTQNASIVWSAWTFEKKSFLSITDNGPGASKANFKALYDDTEVVGIKTGLGLHLIRDLAKAIDCEISVESKIGEGTTFVLVFL
jgi:signal transduction histidine kinase